MRAGKWVVVAIACGCLATVAKRVIGEETGSPSTGEASAGSGESAEALPVFSGSGTVSLDPARSASSDDATGDRWVVSFNGVNGGSIKGTVRMPGVVIPRAGEVGVVDWKLSGTSLSGTVTNEVGGPVLASFTGSVAATGAQGTFAVVDGPSGAWSWEGALPQAGASGN